MLLNMHVIFTPTVKRDGIATSQNQLEQVPAVSHVPRFTALLQTCVSWQMILDSFML